MSWFSSLNPFNKPDSTLKSVDPQLATYLNTVCQPVVLGAPYTVKERAELLLHQVQTDPAVWEHFNTLYTSILFDEVLNKL